MKFSLLVLSLGFSLSGLGQSVKQLSANEFSTGWNANTESMQSRFYNIRSATGNGDRMGNEREFLKNTIGNIGEQKDRRAIEEKLFYIRCQQNHRYALRSTMEQLDSQIVRLVDGLNQTPADSSKYTKFQHMLGETLAHLAILEDLDKQLSDPQALYNRQKNLRYPKNDEEKKKMVYQPMLKIDPKWFETGHEGHHGSAIKHVLGHVAKEYGVHLAIEGSMELIHHGGKIALKEFAGASIKGAASGTFYLALHQLFTSSGRNHALEFRDAMTKTPKSIIMPDLYKDLQATDPWASYCENFGDDYSLGIMEKTLKEANKSYEDEFLTEIIRTEYPDESDCSDQESGPNKDLLRMADKMTAEKDAFANKQHKVIKEKSAPLPKWAVKPKKK